MWTTDIEREVANHQLWLKTNGAKGACADFSKRDLTGIDFSFCNLSWANFEGANL